MKRRMKVIFGTLVMMLLIAILPLGVYAQNRETTKGEAAQSMYSKTPLAGSTRALGETITQTFPDAKMAQAVADKVAGGDLNALIDSTMVNNTTVLDLRGCDIIDIEGIEVFTSLWTLNLSNNEITQIPAELTNLSGLASLELQHNQITQIPAAIANMVNLWQLDLSWNEITTVPSEIGMLSNLHHLELAANQISSVPAEVGNLLSLETLNLGGNKMVAVPVVLTTLPSLTDLDLSLNQLTQIPVEVGDFPTIKNLAINDNKIAQIPVAIGNLSTLQTLDLRFNEISQIPIALTGLPNLQGLYLDSNKITQIPAEIGDLTSLLYLGLGRNEISQIPVTIGNLSNLKTVYLEMNKITEIPIAMTTLSNLLRLDLDHNQIKTVPVEIGNLSNLEALKLDQNEIMALPEALCNLSNLDLIFLNNNQLISLSQTQYDFLSNLNIHIMDHQLYEETLLEMAIQGKAYSFAAHPAYEQFPNYGLTFNFMLTLPDGTQTAITPIVANNRLTLSGSDLKQLGKYTLLAEGTGDIFGLDPVNYSTHFSVGADTSDHKDKTVTDSAKASITSKKLPQTGGGLLSVGYPIALMGLICIASGVILVKKAKKT